MSDIEQFETISGFAKKYNISAVNLRNWMDMAEVKPAAKFGNTNVYRGEDMIAATGKHSTSAAALRAIGWRSPEYISWLESDKDTLVQLNLSLESQLTKAEDLLGEAGDKYAALEANFNGLQASHNDLEIVNQRLNKSMDNQDRAIMELEAKIENLERSLRQNAHEGIREMISAGAIDFEETSD